jgi:cellulose synthase/poly-beta-1,6-N-acetylglucosamine synthase-like glycosyltransferase
MKGVSIITCTKRPQYINNLLNNYHRQRWMRKELIIVLNNDKMKLENYREIAKKYKNVSVYQLPRKASLGKCLNFGVHKSRYSYVAKFDDDDYYAPTYISNSIQTLMKTNADIVGKRAHFMYLEGSKVLIFRFHKAENKFVSIIPGATLVVRRRVFNKVRFPDQNIGEDDKFCLNSRAKGFRIFSAGRFNFAAVRRKNSKNHTWIISDKELLSYSIKFPHIKNYRKFVTRSVRLLNHNHSRRYKK